MYKYVFAFYNCTTFQFPPSSSTEGLSTILLSNDHMMEQWLTLTKQQKVYDLPADKFNLEVNLNLLSRV